MVNLFLVSNQKTAVAAPKAPVVQNFGEVPYNSPTTPIKMIPINLIKVVIIILRTNGMIYPPLFCQLTLLVSLLFALLMRDATVKVGRLST